MPIYHNKPKVFDFAVPHMANLFVIMKGLQVYEQVHLLSD